MTQNVEKQSSSTAKENVQNFPIHMSKKRIIKNIAVICSGVLILCSAYFGILMLQSTMNKEHNIGVLAEALVYGCACMTNLFLPKYIIKRLGSKTSSALFMTAYIPYIAANYYPHWMLMIPASILLGFGGSIFWTSQATYLKDISALYANKEYDIKANYVESLETSDNSKQSIESYKHIPDVLSTNENCIDSRHTVQKEENHVTSVSFVNMDMSSRNTNIRRLPTLSNEKVGPTTAMIFGIHGMAYVSSIMWSNLMSYYIIKNEMNPNYFVRNSSCICGAKFCSIKTNCFDNDLKEVSDETRYILITVYVSLAIIATLIVTLLLDPLESKINKEPFSLRLLMATLNLAKRKELILLSPSSFYIGQINGFYIADITKAYISCALGTYNVPLVTVCYGGFCGLSSIFSGYLVKSFGRKFVFSTAAILNITVNLIVLWWNPDPSKLTMFYIVAAMYGAYGGAIFSQLRALYGVLLKADGEAAFANFEFWHTLGLCFSFAFSGYACTFIKIYVLLAVSIIAYIGYLFVEKSSNKCVPK